MKGKKSWIDLLDEKEKDGVDFVLLFIEIVANIVVILLLYLFFRILTFKYL